MRIVLTDYEQFVATNLGAWRQAENDAKSVVDRRVARDRSSLEVHIDGAGAEIAFCRIANVYPDFTTQPRRGGVDCTLPDGRTVDVKSTRGKILRGNGTADLYVLAIGSFPSYDFVGVAERSALAANGGRLEANSLPMLPISWILR